MDTTPAVVETPQAAAPAVIPAAPSAPADSSLNPISDKVSAANSPAAIRALVNAAKAGKIGQATPAAPAAPAAEPQATTPEATPAEESPVPEGEAAPSAEAAPAAVEGEPGEHEEDESPLTPFTGDKARIRVSENDKAGRLAISIIKRNKDLTISEALERANKQLGIVTAPPAAAPSEVTPAAPAASDLPQTLADTDAALTALEDEREKALNEVRLEDVAKMDRKLRQLDRHRTALERNAEKSEVQAVTDYNVQFDQSNAKAVELYEFARQPESAAAKRMAEIDSALKDNADPLYGSPDKPLRIAQMVAAEMNIAPRRKGTPAPAPARPAAPAAPAPTTIKKQVLPTGGSRTLPAVDQTTQVAKHISEIKNPAQLRAALKSFGIRR